jgi:hypothetical protein
MTVSLDQLPASAAAVWVRLRDELLTILGDNLVALWAYGARTFPEPPLSLGDHDTYGVLRGNLDNATGERIRQARESIEREHSVNIELKFVLATDAAKPEAHEEVWAFHRAHWLAGRYVLLHGGPPEDFVSKPSWSEIEAAVLSELEHIERHVAAGDDDPYEASYAILQGCRILYTIETRAPVISKRAAGDWGLEKLPERWHEAIRASGRAYDGEASPKDEETLKAAMGPFVAMVREESPLVRNE